MTFGDIEPDDVFSAEGDPDPDQVAVRLHELRAEVEALVGIELDAWDRLDPVERSLARAVGAVVVDWLITTDPDEPALAAAQLHAVRRYWSGDRLPRWGSLTPEQREIGTALMALVIDWLRREGSL